MSTSIPAEIPERLVDEAQATSQVWDDYAWSRFSCDSRQPQQEVRNVEFPDLYRIMIDPQVMGGKPCIRGMRITVGTVTGLLAS